MNGRTDRQSGSNQALFHRTGFHFFQGDPQIEAADYVTWQKEFMRGRLRLWLRLGLVYFCSFLVIDVLSFLTGNNPLSGIWLINGAIRSACLVLCLGLLNTQYGRQRVGLVFLIASWSLTLIRQISETLRLMMPASGFPEGTPETFTWVLFTWAVMFFSQATLLPVRWKLHLISQLGTLAYYFGVNPALGLNVVPADESWASLLLKVFWICLIANLSVYLYEKLARAEFYARRRLRAERERSEKLLLNILPESIAERLKQEPRIIADNFKEVTVLFADIVGFTQLSARLKPEEVVNLLNQTFSVFDQLADRYHLEKIKTIGDAYMVVAGLPEEQSNHAAAIADMALSMKAALVQFNQQTGQTLSIRIGVHTGPAVAGVIGLKKFAYDLWGDTVNTASRMESYGVPGEIQVTQATYSCLKSEYHFEPRGTIVVKGKGEMTTYFLKGKKASPSTL